MQNYNLMGFKDVHVSKIGKGEIDKIDLVVLDKPMSIAKWYSQQSLKPDIVVNAGFFNMSTGVFVFDVMDEGQVIHDDSNYDFGIGITDNNTVQYGKMSENRWRDFVTAYPPLVVDGKRYNSTIGKEIDYGARRTLFGYNDDNIYVVTVDSKMNFNGCKDALISLGVTNGINLDGGGSTMKMVNGNKVTKNTYCRPVPSMLAIYLKKDPAVIPDMSKVRYTVQVGAFSKKPNAVAMQNRVKALPDKIKAGYKNAYVTWDGKLYRVQVFVSRKPEPAKRVMNDLKNYGIDGYVKKFYKK